MREVKEEVLSVERAWAPSTEGDIKLVSQAEAAKPQKSPVFLVKIEGNKVEPGVGQAQGGQDKVKVSGFDRDLKLQVHTVCVPTAAAMEGNKVEQGVG